jgi:hypothetical protein
VAEHIANPWGGPSVIGQNAAFSGHPPLAARLLASRLARSESFNLRRTWCAILGLKIAAHCYLCTRGVLVACDDERRYALVVRVLPFGQVYDALCCHRALVQQRVYPRSARRPSFCLGTIRRIASRSRSSPSMVSMSRMRGAYARARPASLRPISWRVPVRSDRQPRRRLRPS